MSTSRTCLSQRPRLFPLHVVPHAVAARAGQATAATRAILRARDRTPGHCRALVRLPAAMAEGGDIAVHCPALAHRLDAEPSAHPPTRFLAPAHHRAAIAHAAILAHRLRAAQDPCPIAARVRRLRSAGATAVRRPLPAVTERAAAQHPSRDRLLAAELAHHPTIHAHRHRGVDATVAPRRLVGEGGIRARLNRRGRRRLRERWRRRFLSSRRKTVWSTSTRRGED